MNCSSPKAEATSSNLVGCANLSNGLAGIGRKAELRLSADCPRYGPSPGFLETETAAQAGPLDGGKWEKQGGVSEGENYHVERLPATPRLVISDALRATLNRPIRDPELFNAFLSGEMRGKGPSTPPKAPPANRYARRFARKWQRSPDRAASVHRRRKLGGSGGMPDTIRHHYTEGQRAALSVIAGEVKHHGICDLPIDRIAAVAGVSRTTVQNAIREARLLGHLAVDMRPRRGQKNLTNIVRVISAEWKAWIKRGPSLARSIGFKSLHPTKNKDKIQSFSNETGAVGGAARGLGKGVDGATSCPRRLAGAGR